MSSTIINRVVNEEKAILTNSVDTTATILLDGYSTLQIAVPSGYASTTLTVHSHSTPLASWLPLRDDTNTAVVATITAGSARNLPVSLFNAAAIRLVTNNAGDNAVTVGIIKKS